MEGIASLFAPINLQAHILPGMLVIIVIYWFLSRDFEDMKTGIRSLCFNTSGSIAVLIVLLFLSSAVGLILDGFRSTSPDIIMHDIFKLQFPEEGYSALYKPEMLETIRQLDQDYFRYYQFYLNTGLVGILVVILSIIKCFLYKRYTFHLSVTAGALLLIYYLVRAAKKSLESYYYIIRIVGGD